jgi:NTP pyrophosphatase (non-canonical NTP hydrolase)
MPEADAIAHRPAHGGAALHTGLADGGALVGCTTETDPTDPWPTITRLTAWLDTHNGRSSTETALRLLKVTEEAGEVAQAWIGMTGQNPRKGVTHTAADVADELCDVITAAMVALTTIITDPAAHFTRKVQQIAALRLDNLPAANGGDQITTTPTPDNTSSTDATVELTTLRQRFADLQDEIARQQAVHDRTAQRAHTIEAEVRRLTTIMREHHSPYGTTADYARRLIEVIEAALRESYTGRPISKAVNAGEETRMVRIAVTGPTAGDADVWAQSVADLVVGNFGREMRLHVTVDGRPVEAEQR